MVHRTQRRFLSFLCIEFLSLNISAIEKRSEPNFLLRDQSDGKCFSGTSFQRCSADTIWFVTGKSSEYQMHLRSSSDAENICLERTVCETEYSDLYLKSCDSICANSWNILGDDSTGFILTEGEKSCLHRVGDVGTIVPCSDTTLTLSFSLVSDDDIKSMNEPKSKMNAAAAKGDIEALKNYIKDGLKASNIDWDGIPVLNAAAAAGHADVVNYLLEQGADVNNMDKDGITALMEASMAGHLDVVRSLLKKKVNVDAQVRSGATALLLASGEGREEVVSELLSNNASHELSRADGMTPLMSASLGGHTNIVEMLLDKGADAGAFDDDGVTALINAAEAGSIEIITLLLNKGVDVSHMATQGYTALIVAAAGGHLDICKLLIDAGARPDEGSGASALMYAAAGGHSEVIKFLLLQGADPNKKMIDSGATAIVEAATNGTVSILQSLIEGGADVNAKDDQGMTALMFAANAGNTAACEYLIKAGIDPNVMAYSGGTALMFSAISGHYDASKVLISAGADVNAAVVATPEYLATVKEALESGEEGIEPHKDGVTSLMLAAQAGHHDLVKLLLENGANVNDKDEEDMTALLEAARNSNFDIATMLLNAGADPNHSYIDENGVAQNLLFDMIESGRTEFSLSLLEKGADIRHVGDNGVTLLMAASFRGMTDVVKKLVELTDKKDINAVMKDGSSALLLAANENNVEVLEALILSGANVNHSDADGTTALMIAASSAFVDAVKVLVKGGAHLNLQNKDGHSALMFAHNGLTQIEILMEQYADYLLDTEDGGESTDRMLEEAKKSYDEVLLFLQKSGADKNLKDNEGRTASDFAHNVQSKKDSEFVSEL